MNDCSGNIKIFTCNANKELADQIARALGQKLGKSEVSRFSNGEISVKIDETVRSADVFIVQPTSPPANDNLMELLIMTDAMRRASAGRINAVIPYFGYARQDRKARARDPISAKLVADLITVAGVDRVLTMDLHCAQIQGFFNIPMDHLRGMPLFYQYYKEKFQTFDDVVVASPDLGSVARARAFSDRIDTPMAIVDKRRPKMNESEVMNIIGSVDGKRVIIIDDEIDTAGSITNAANALLEQGATEVYVASTHAVLSGPAIERLSVSPIKEILFLDTIPIRPENKLDKIKTISVAPIFAEAVHRIHEGLPVSKLFD